MTWLNYVDPYSFEVTNMTLDWTCHVDNFCVGRLKCLSCTHRFSTNNVVETCTIQYITVQIRWTESGWVASKCVFKKFFSKFFPHSGHKKLGIFGASRGSLTQAEYCKDDLGECSDRGWGSASLYDLSVYVGHCSLSPELFVTKRSAAELSRDGSLHHHRFHIILPHY